MKTAITFLLALAASGQASWLDPGVGLTASWLTSWLDPGVGLTVKFGFLNSFFSVPLTIEKAIEEKWIKATQLDDVPELYKELVMYCCECDGPICALYEQHSGYVAGLQIGLNKEDFYDSPYDIMENGFKEWTWTCGGTSRTFYINRQYYITDEFLAKSAEDRIQSYDDTKILQNRVVVTDGPGGEQLRTPDDGTQVHEEGIFTKQACIPSMGTHYYYNMSSAVECSAQSMYPWFMLVHDEKVIGCALATFGKLKKQSGSRDWFEHPPLMAVKRIVNDGPKCMYDYAKDPGALTSHVYFVKHPTRMLC